MYPDEKVEAFAVFVLLVSSPPAEIVVVTKSAAMVDASVLADSVEPVDGALLTTPTVLFVALELLAAISLANIFLVGGVLMLVEGLLIDKALASDEDLVSDEKGVSKAPGFSDAGATKLKKKTSRNRLIYNHERNKLQSGYIFKTLNENSYTPAKTAQSIF